MPTQLIPLIVQIIQLAIQYVPTIAQECKLAIDLIHSGGDPTPEQIVQIDAALEKANQALQQAIADAGNDTQFASVPATQAS